MDNDAPEVAVNSFLAMWCSDGLECIFDVTALSKEAVWATLKGDSPPKTPFNLAMMKLRARYNSQRSYEIYTFTSAIGISKQDIEELFDTDPQFIAEWIRAHGNKLYSDYFKPTRAKIT